jgi:putative ABC transport system ATP-binding protein
MTEAIISLRGVTKHYVRGKQTVEVLHGVNLQIASGEFVALMGPSGSGKTTLLNLIGGLDQASTGEVVVAGERLDQMSGGRLAKWRARHVGFVFQFYNLMPMLSAQRAAQCRVAATADFVVVRAAAQERADRLAGGRARRSRGPQAQ